MLSQPQTPAPGSPQQAQGGGMQYQGGFLQNPHSPSPSPSPGNQPPGRKRGAVLPWVVSLSAGAVLCLALVAAFAYPGFAVTQQISADDLQGGIGNVLAEQFHLVGYDSPSCPSGLPAEKGAVITCSVNYHGASLPVAVVVHNEGAYEVFPPGMAPFSAP